MKFGVVILAAGASSRMGRPKLLLPWKGGTVLGHLLQQWQALGASSIAVVCAPAQHALLEELDRLRVPTSQRISNPQPARGMFSSIQVAAAWPGWPAGLSHVAVALGDQPLVGRETLRQLINFAGANPARVSQPSRGGRGRHPVFLPVAILPPLAAACAETFKHFLRNCGAEIALRESDDAGLDLDLDDPADYERARQWVAAGA